MTDVATLLNEANKASEIIDQTEVTQGVSGRLAAPGVSVARFVGYVERGMRDQEEYQGKKKDDCAEVYLTFELLGKDNLIETEVDGVKRKEGILVRPFPIAIKLNEKAKFYKLFQRMRNGRDSIKHMSQMLNEAFLVKIVHNESKDGKRTYANIELDNGVFSINPPFTPVLDEAGVPTTEMRDLSPRVPPATAPFRLFLFDQPSQAQWDSLYIDGTYTTKVNGVDVEKTKNYIQEDIKEALNWAGSPMHVMLSGLPTEEVAEAEVIEKAPEPEPISTDDTSLLDDMFDDIPY